MSETSLPAVAAHGATRLPSVDLDSYNVELKDDEGFIGDRASKGAFRDIIENWRDALRKLGEDPLGDDESEDLTKKKLDDLLTHGDPEGGGTRSSGNRRIFTGICIGDPAFPQDQRVEGHAAYCG
jgi:hypothetical protein